MLVLWMFFDKIWFCLCFVYVYHCQSKLNTFKHTCASQLPHLTHSISRTIEQTLDQTKKYICWREVFTQLVATTTTQRHHKWNKSPSQLCACNWHLHCLQDLLTLFHSLFASFLPQIPIKYHFMKWHLVCLCASACMWCEYIKSSCKCTKVCVHPCVWFASCVRVCKAHTQHSTSSVYSPCTSLPFMFTMHKFLIRLSRSHSRSHSVSVCVCECECAWVFRWALLCFCMHVLCVWKLTCAFSPLVLFLSVQTDLRSTFQMCTLHTQWINGINSRFTNWWVSFVCSITLNQNKQFTFNCIRMPRWRAYNRFSEHFPHSAAAFAIFFVSRTIQLESVKVSFEHHRLSLIHVVFLFLVFRSFKRISHKFINRIRTITQFSVGSQFHGKFLENFASEESNGFHFAWKLFCIVHRA